VAYNDCPTIILKTFYAAEKLSFLALREKLVLGAPKQDAEKAICLNKWEIMAASKRTEQKSSSGPCSSATQGRIGNFVHTATKTLKLTEQGRAL
jgi:hypothetical protein